MPENCTRCGVANKEDAEFCVSCGESLKAEKKKKVDEKKESSQNTEK
ncbi:MAG: zinc-ribbon domain-containing protein [Candidatus Heimdallarchaeota archaeon]